MNLSKIKSLFFKVLIGCLVASALLAIVTILSGSFNDTSAKALFTILLIAIHALISISFIASNEKQKTFESLEFFTNVTFGIIILSFITSVLGTWEILPGDVVAKLYGLYLVLLFAVLHGEVLAKIVGKQANIDKIIFTNYLFMTIVVLMLVPVIFTGFGEELGAFYYRLLAAVGIVDATLTLIAVILHTLYIQKHPEIKDPVFGVQQQIAPTTYDINGQPIVAPVQPMQPVQPPKRHMNIFVMLLLAYLAVQVVSVIVIAIMGAVNHG